MGFFLYSIYVALVLFCCSVWCVSFRCKNVHNSCVYTSEYTLFSQFVHCGSIYADFDCEQFVDSNCSVCGRINVDSMHCSEFPSNLFRFEWKWLLTSEALSILRAEKHPPAQNFCHLQIKRLNKCNNLPSNNLSIKLSTFSLKSCSLILIAFWCAQHSSRLNQSNKNEQ